VQLVRRSLCACDCDVVCRQRVRLQVWRRQQRLVFD
jgi:hypothetical protein